MFALDPSARRAGNDPALRGRRFTRAPRSNPSTHSSRVTSRKTFALCFHIHTDSFCRNYPIFTFMQDARGVTPLGFSWPRSFLTKKTQLACFQSLPHSLVKTWECARNSSKKLAVQNQYDPLGCTAAQKQSLEEIPMPRLPCPGDIPAAQPQRKRWMIDGVACCGAGNGKLCLTW